LRLKEGSLVWEIIFASVPRYFLDHFMDLAPEHRAVDIALVEEFVSPLRRLQVCTPAMLFY